MTENFILKDELEKIGYSPKKNQDRFFKEMYDFLHSDKKFLVARGGMGLGKTISTEINIKTVNNNFSKFFIATPFAKTKDSWANDLNALMMEYAIWISKANCCKQYHSDISDCNDECPHRAHLEANGRYTTECDMVCKELLKVSPITASEYYSKYGDVDCLWPVVKNGLQKQKINIGDYLPTFNLGMLNNMIFSNGGSIQNSLLIYDEAHRLPNRLKAYFSRRLAIKKRIDGLEDEAKNLTGNSYIELYYFIQILKKWYKSLEKILKTSSENQEFYSFSDFLSHFKYGEYPRFLHLLETLSTLIVVNDEKFKNEDEMKNCEIWKKFLEYWESVSLDKTYEGYVQTIKKYDNEEIMFELKCIDVRDKAPYIMSRWKKVIFISGTIDETFLDEMGLDKNDSIVTDKINSFTIKDDCIIYAKGAFTSGKRENTIKEYGDQIREMIANMDGRTILFIPAMNFSNILEEALSGINRPIFNACNKNQMEKSKVLEDYVHSKNGILIFAIRQGIDGENLVTEDENDIMYAVENAIVLGYPYKVPDKVHKKILEIEEKKIKEKHPYLMGTKTMAKKIVEYFPISRDIHQAVTRLKRNEHDVPCIILFGEEFNRKDEKSCLDSDLSSHTEYTFSKVLEFIKKQNSKRKEVQNGRKDKE